MKDVTLMSDYEIVCMMRVKVHWMSSFVSLDEGLRLHGELEELMDELETRMFLDNLAPEK